MDEEREAALVAALADDDCKTPPAPPRPDLTPNQLAAMARDMATNVKEIEDILEAYKITQAQYAAHIHQNGYFQQLLQSYAKEWESIKSTNKRLAFQAAAALEEKLPALAYRMGNASENLSDVTSVAKLFTQLAGAGPTPGVSPTGEGDRFAIQIIIGRNTVEIETGARSESKELSDTPRIHAPVLPNTEVSRNTLEIQALTGGPGGTTETPPHPEPSGVHVPIPPNSKIP